MIEGRRTEFSFETTLMIQNSKFEITPMSNMWNNIPLTFLTAVASVGSGNLEHVLAACLYACVCLKLGAA